MFSAWNASLSGKFPQTTTIEAQYDFVAPEKQDKSLKLSQDIPAAQDFITNLAALVDGVSVDWKD